MRKLIKTLTVMGITLALSVTPVTPKINTNNIATVEAKKALTQKQCRSKLLKYLKKKKLYKKKYYLQYDHKAKNRYIFQYYEMAGDHTATIGWYGVNKKNGRIYDELFCHYLT